MLRHRWYKRLWMPLLLALVLPNACKQKEKAKNDPNFPEFSTTNESVLVDSGSSAQPSFSPKGDRLLFVSAKRPGHTQAQVYDKDLQSGQETRITFQNGDVSHPVYHPKEDFILYSSSTDELKENPPLLRPSTAASQLPALFQEPIEIYLHSLKGLEITRLTETPGFDGEARFSADGKFVTWTRARENKTEILQMNRSSHAIKILSKLGSNPTQYAVSPDGKWQAWVDWDASFIGAKLKVQKFKKEMIEIMPDLAVPKTDTEFSPDSKWLFWAQLDPATGTYQLWSYELETGCARKLTDNKDSDRRHPTLSPDLKRLVYTATIRSTARKADVSASESFRQSNVLAGESFRPPNVQSRILQVGFAPPTGPCAQTP